MTNVERVLRATTTPLAFATMLGVKVRAGSRPDRFRCCCVWHTERNPSCEWTTRDGRIVAYCHSCHSGGDIFQIAAAAWGMSIATSADFYDVLRRLAELLNVTLDDTSGKPAKEPDPVDAIVEVYMSMGEGHRLSDRSCGILMRATQWQMDEARRRVDLQWALARESVDRDKARNDELDEMGDDVLSAVARREAAALKRLRMVPDLFTLHDDAAERAAIQAMNDINDLEPA